MKSAQVALAWLLAKPSVISVIIGASKPEQFAENVGAASLTLAQGVNHFIPWLKS
jgi:aryl-alcohol dehydrogenase-like predicted oxidoreductase